MKKYIIIFLSLLAFNVNAQRKIPAGGTAGQFLKILPNGLSLGWGAASGGSTDTTSLSNRINLKYNTADTLNWTFTSPLKRMGNNVSIPAATGSISGYLSSTDWTTFNNKLSSITAGNGIITSGSTIYVDTLKVASRRTPTFLTDITTPLIIGGTSTTSSLTYKTTTGIGATGADHIFRVGNNGATEAMRILNSGNVGIGTNNPSSLLYMKGGYFKIEHPTQSAMAYMSNSATNGFTTGRSFDNNNVNDFFIYDNVAGANRLNISAAGNIGLGGTTSPVSKLHIGAAPTAANVGLVSLGNGAWDGSSPGFFTGIAAGTLIAGNLASGSTSDLLNLQIAGVNRFKATNEGSIVASGGLQLGYVAKTANYTLTASDYTVNATSNSFTITLPTAIGCAGRIYNIKNSGTGVITINTTSSQTIDGNASGTLTLNQYDNLQIQSDGANFIIL